MNLFDQLVLEAMKNKAELAPLRVVVEKELLQHDIIREMSVAGLLDTLTLFLVPMRRMGTLPACVAGRLNAR